MGRELGRMHIRYSESVSQSGKKKGNELILSKAKRHLDKSGNSSIMTSNKGDEDDNNRRHETYRQGILRTESAGVRGTDMHSRMEDEDEPGRRKSERATAKATSGEEHSRELHKTGMAPCVAWPRAIREEILERDSD